MNIKSALRCRAFSSSDVVGKQANVPFSAPVQRKLFSSLNNSYQTEAALNLPQGQQLSPVVSKLLLSADNYYMHDGVPNYQAATFRVLKEKKYLLGEDHGDGTWAARTQSWSYIPKMREGIKLPTGQSAEENAAIQTMNPNQAQGNQAQELPLEDRHAYALTKILMTKQLLAQYDNVLLAKRENMVEEHLNEVSVLIIDYATAGSAWFKRVGVPPANSRADHFMRLGLSVLQEPGWNPLKDIASKQRAVTSLNPKDIQVIQTMLAEIVKHLIELIDTRPPATGMKSLIWSREGQDPIPNRVAIEKLNKGGTGSLKTNMLAALSEGNVLREQAMIRNIRSTHAPLLVQVGEEHVDRLHAVLGAEAIPIKKGIDFDDTTTEK